MARSLVYTSEVINMRKTIALLLISVLLVGSLTGCLTGCSGKGSSTETKVTKASHSNDVASTELVTAIPTHPPVKETEPDETLVEDGNYLPDYDELTSKKGIMIKSTFGNGGEVCSTDDYLSSAEFVVKYDGTLLITAEYNLSGTLEGEFILDRDEYLDCYILGKKGIDCLDTSSDTGCDMDTWTYHFEDGDTRYDFKLGYYSEGDDYYFSFPKLMYAYLDLMQ